MTDAPFAGRKLHFVGIGGAGMSGLAIVSKALGAEVTGSDRAESSYTARLREHGIEPSIGHDAANVPAGRPAGRLHRHPSGQPRAGGGRGAAAAPRRAARRGLAAQALDRRGGHARQDHDLRHGRPRAGRGRPRPRLPDRRGAALHRLERGLGGGGVDRGRGRRVRPLVPGARARRGRGHQRRARPPSHLRLAGRARGGVRRVHRGRRGHDQGGRPRGRGSRAAAPGLPLHGRGHAGAS